VSVCR